MIKSCRWLHISSLVLLVLPLTIAACAPAGTAIPEEPQVPEATSVTESGPKYGGELHFLAIVDVSQQAGLDPAVARTQSQWIFGDLVFDTLVEITPDGDIVPALANDWEISDGGLEYTFTLNDNVFFHNGRAMASEDVKYSIERVANPETGSPRLQNFTSIDSIKAPDDQTVVITLKEPFAPLLATLSHMTAAVIPREEVEKGDFGNTPVGTGPFVLTEWERDERLVFEANQDYWRPGLPYLDRIVVTFSGDDNARVAALRAGDADFLHQVPIQFVDLLKENPSVNVYGGERAGLSWQHLELNSTKPPFDDVRVRQAIFAALDRQTIAEAGKPGHSTPIDAGFLPEWHWAALDEIIWKQDYDRARMLLEEAGYGDGFTFTQSVVAGFEFQTRTAEAIQQQLKPLGIEANIEVADFGVVFNSATSGTFDSIVLVFSPTFDPDERVQQTFVCDGGLNWTGFCDPEVDQWADAARRTTDRVERARFYRMIQRRVAENGSWASLYMYDNFDAVRSYVKGYTYYPQFYYRSLRNVWLDQ